MSSQNGDDHDRSNYLAEDRTFLAWIRTGIALMGFGFVVARFGLFLRELEATQSGSPLETTAFSVILGTALIVCGVFVMVLSSWQYLRRNRELQHGVKSSGTPSKLALFVALVLSAAGLAMAVYIGSQKPTAHFTTSLNSRKHAIDSSQARRTYTPFLVQTSKPQAGSVR